MQTRLLCLAALLLPQYGLAVDDQVGAKIDYGTFENPAARVRPRFRYWLPDASVDPAIVQKNIKEAGINGAGGVEFLPYYDYGNTVPGADWVTYGFGTPAFVKIFKAALQAHKDAGLVMDFPLGPNQGQGVPASPDDEGLQWDLSTASIAVPLNGSFHRQLPGWGTGELVALVSAQVLSSRNISNPTNSLIPGSEVQPSAVQYVLKNSTLQEWSQNVTSMGEVNLSFPKTGGQGYRLFAFYQHRTLHQNVPSTSNMSGTIFNGGSYAVDHFSARGAETVTRFWDEYILEDEVKQMLVAVGNYGWEDSMEIKSNVSWTPDLPNIFQKKHGYNIKKYLPLIIYKNNNIGIQSTAPGTIQCLLDTPDQGSGYINDYRSALVEGYRAYLQGLTQWVNGMNLQYSSQVGYNLNIDVLANVPDVNAPECESLGFSDSVDGYRQFVGPATLAGKRVISNEMGAVFDKAYQHSVTALLWEIARAVAGGVNQFVLHGQTFSGNYVGTTWPGNTPFYYLFSELYSEKQPSWNHGFSEALNYVARLQYTQQKGQSKVDVVIYNKDSATDAQFGTIYNETDLIEEGFTYLYLSPDNFALPQARVENSTLAPNGPGFRAMIIPSSGNLTIEAVRDIKRFARNGLPVILSGGLPNAFYTGDGNTDSLMKEISSLKEVQNVHIVSSGQASKQLKSLGVVPRVQLQTSGTWYSTWHSDADGVDYLFVLGDTVDTVGSVSVATAKRPYVLDPWTGSQTPVLEYQQKSGRTVVPLRLAANQTAIIGFSGTPSNTSLYATQVPSSVVGYKYGNRTNNVQLHVSSGSTDQTLRLSNGKTISQLTTKDPAPGYQLTNWTLTVEHWERPDNLSDASIIAVKHNTTHELTSLISWQEIPSIANASGVGYYTTTIPWPPTSKIADGAYLFLPQTANAARVYMNGHRLPAFDFQAPKLDLSAYLVSGENELTVEVPSTMWNYLRTMLGELYSAGSLPQLEESGPDPVDNGLIGVARVVPFVSMVEYIEDMIPGLLAEGLRCAMAGSVDPDLPEPWTVKDIVCVSIIGPLMLAAFVEWLLFLAAFLYCLVKVYQKAEHWSIKVLAVTMMILFTSLRGVFLPIMVVTLPLPPQLTQEFPPEFVSFLQWFAFWTFSALLTIPWLFCVHRLVTTSIGRTQRIKEVLDERTAPKTVIVMPVYKENPTVLIKAINSVVDSDYPSNCIHVFLSYDGVIIDEPYLRVIHHLGIPICLDTYPQSIDVTYRGARITVSRFKHGGKRYCQKLTFKLISQVYEEYNTKHDDLFMLFIDSDCILDRLCLQNFMYEMELKPGSKHNMLAMTGIITSTTEKNSLITVLQDLEYIHGQLFERSVESGCGAVTCLPGALTILRFSAFRKMARHYFADKAEQCEDLFDYAKCHLGEDRWLTHLFMIGAKERYQIQMCTSAFCKTAAAQTLRTLLKQRRRWFLGYITNEACMLTDIRLWRRYPFLCLVRLMQNTIRTTALLFFVQVIALMTTSSRVADLPIGFIAISLGLNYVLMFYFGIRLKRYKAWLYPLMFVVNPFFNWLYMVYGILTAGQRTWGGPRADAAKADEHTSPEEAVEQARAQGDELNVMVDTFRSKADKKGCSNRASEQIDRRLSGLPEPRNSHPANHDEAMVPLASLMTSPLDVPRIGLHPNCSSDTVVTDSSSNSISLPMDVESLMNEEDRAKRSMALQAQELASTLEQLATGPDNGDMYTPRPAMLQSEGPETHVASEQPRGAPDFTSFQRDNTVHCMPPMQPQGALQPTSAQQSVELGVMTGNHRSLRPLGVDAYKRHRGQRHSQGALSTWCDITRKESLGRSILH
ncbi:hypothetical protein ANOM_004910 [Aspergillus nomiae NRRL 13137]|uniref:chitin synthase n=1 Tax=Aspergillus nomiae NRRL (strain ATCC 15546 / NRRL 13137 / CBS 260.88 / M93) TaxID=1509407 RepID=A0A0L1J5Z0_ASPN3|nr:uncharacterized protein ANOM_004910 [Aspergillus nomiae NRRL 13137]KNG86833.1 hypothetical protein ANOM_004910 [Aspergillus nomiae NRRL 13137]